MAHPPQTPKYSQCGLTRETEPESTFDQMRQFIIGLSPEACVLYNFTRKGAVDENCLAFQASDSTGFMIQRLDNTDRHKQLRKKAQILTMD